MLNNHEMKNIAYLSLGSNIDEREENLKQSLEKLDCEESVSIIKTSSIYETAPVGYTDQSSFLNMVVKLETNLTPQELLEKTQFIELTGGRKRAIRWGPRTIDLDILLFNEENIILEHLIIPHPRMFERGFVLIPLQEIAPGLKYNGKLIEQYIAELTDKEGVHKWKSSSGVDVSGLSEN